jgi:hypothetical protein
MSWEDVEAEAARKRDERGGFDRRIFLEYVDQVGRSFVSLRSRRGAGPRDSPSRTAAPGGRRPSAAAAAVVDVCHSGPSATHALMGGRRDRDVPQSRGMQADDAALRAYHERGMERERLSDGRG